ncbi:MAG: AAA family ATPase [Bacteroidetes bacterium]|nr:AAA family ATPase [Bacteroidota bacterium]
MNPKYLFRFIDIELEQWAESPSRKPLLLRGARQVGKTTVIRNLAKGFEHYIEINFEEHREVHDFFNKNLSPDEIIENISIYFNVPVIPSKTLLFFDEIQACIPALSSLRFFYEKQPDLHIIAAGSLLEFALQSIPSHGVGRIRSMFLYPLSFDEFLIALGEQELIKYRSKHSAQKPINDVFHEKLKNYLRKFIILGGMPEVIKGYIFDNNIIECQRIIDDLILTYIDDFAKYKDRIPAERIVEVFRSIVLQLGGKFVYSKASPQSNHYQIKEALDYLVRSGLALPIVHSTAAGLPLGANTKPKNTKMVMIDTGIAHRLAGLDIKSFLSSDSVEFVNKGGIAEMFVGLEILKTNSAYEKRELFYWQREAHNSNAEVDFLLQKGIEILPVEVKSGTKGSMQSLHLFMKEKNIQVGVRISLENYSTYKNIIVVPMYAIRDFLTME